MELPEINEVIYVDELVGAYVRACVPVPVNSFMLYEYYTAQFWL